MARRRRCAFCNTPLPADARATQKYCDADCRRGRKKPKQLVDEPPTRGPVVEATELAIADAVKERRLGPLDVGTIAAIRVLAQRIDEDHLRAEVWQAAVVWARENETEPPKPPALDNVSIPTYLNYAVSLGLTPSGRKNTEAAPGKGAAPSGGKLLNLVGAIPKPS